MATMAASFLETWQNAAFQEEAYSRCKNYSALVSLLILHESTTDGVLKWRGNQPALKHNRLTDWDVKVLACALRRVQSAGAPSGLDLGYNSITDEGLWHLSEWIKEETCSLKTLHLSYNDFTHVGVSKLCDALQFNKSLHTIVLDGNTLGHVGGLQVAAMLQVNLSIARLGLASTDLDTDSVIAMATVLGANKVLRAVDISRPLLHSKMEESTIHLSTMLQVNNSLQELHLAKHTITDTGVEWLCRYLSTNATLKHLNLSCNRLSQDGAKHLSGMLRVNSTLTVLNISSNCIEDDGLCSISEAVKSNLSLQWLDVCSNGIGDKGLCALAAALWKNSSLTTVLLWGNTLGQPTCNAFRVLFERLRLKPDDTDVRPYEVDGTNFLARTDHCTNNCISLVY